MRHFSQTAEYALRIMAQLTITEASVPLSSHDLSKSTGISIHFLSKVLRRLVNRGFLTSKKGCGGGYALARPPKEIRFIDILKIGNSPPEPDHCIFGWKKCRAENPCPLHPLWADMKKSFQKWTENTTLANLKR